MIIARLEHQEFFPQACPLLGLFMMVSIRINPAPLSIPSVKLGTVPLRRTNLSASAVDALTYQMN